MRYLGTFFFLMLVGCVPAHALDFTFSAGATRATTVPSGIWWEAPYAHSLPTYVPSFTLRADKTLTSDWELGAGYTYVGRFQSTALAKASDQAISANAPYPLSHWNGDEKVEGLFLVARRNIGQWYVELGPAVTRSSWKMFIPDWVPCTDPACLLPDTPRPLTVGTPRQIHWDLIGGIGYKFDARWSANLSVYPTRIAGEFPGITKGYSATASVGFTF